MKVVSLGFPKSVFPFRSVSQRLNLEYDEIDETMDALFAELFETDPPAADGSADPQSVDKSC